jgi:hypothetical protein
MQEQVEKSKKTEKGAARTGTVTKQKSSRKNGLGFRDNRPEAMSQRSLQLLMNTSRRLSHTRSLNKIIKSQPKQSYTKIRRGMPIQEKIYDSLGDTASLKVNGDVCQMYWGESYVNAAIDYVKSATWEQVTTQLATIATAIGTATETAAVSPGALLSKAILDISKSIYDIQKNWNYTKQEEYQKFRAAKFKIATGIAAAIVAGGALAAAIKGTASAAFLSGLIIALNQLFGFITGAIENKAQQWKLLAEEEGSS